MPDQSVQCCVTSPPYWGLRLYVWGGDDEDCKHAWPADPPGAIMQCQKCGAQAGTLGLEKTPGEFIHNVVAVLREVRRVLRDDGVCFVNVGDSYASNSSEARPHMGVPENRTRRKQAICRGTSYRGPGVRSKSLCLIPERLALALQAPTEKRLIQDIAGRAWMAGLVDGEGCFSADCIKATKGALNPTYQAHLQIHMVDTEAIDRAMEVSGIETGKRSDYYPKSSQDSGKSPIAKWRVWGDNLLGIIADIYPYLTVKKTQALLAYNLQHLRKGVHASRGNPLPSENVEKRALLYRLIRQMNQRQGPVDIPSWCVEPDVQTEPGWIIRSRICWTKGSAMPESVRDRPTSAWEHIWFMSKQGKYYADMEAVRQVDRGQDHARSILSGQPSLSPPGQPTHQGIRTASGRDGTGANLRNHWEIEETDSAILVEKWAWDQMALLAFGVSDEIPGTMQWHINPEPFPEAHFATFPSEIPRRCILMGTSAKGCCPECGAAWERVVEKGGGTTGKSWHNHDDDLRQGQRAGTPEHRRAAADGYESDYYRTTTGWRPGCDHGLDPVPQTVLDPFAGSCTTGLVSEQLGRDSILIELNPEYCAMGERRIEASLPLARRPNREDPQAFRLEHT
jgi:DNA modification methylase